MVVKAKVTAAVVAIAGILTWQLGLFDRPEFKHHETLLQNDHQHDLYALVATTKGSCGPQVKKLATATLKGIESLTDSKDLLQAAAKLYPGAPDGAERLALSVYFDDPDEVKEENMRWALGWAVQSSHGGFGAIQSVVDKVQEASGLDNDETPIRAIRISNKGSVLKASIPWRNFFTPFIQPRVVSFDVPRIQWSRGFKVYEDGGYKKNDDVSEDEHKAPLALEVYVTGPNDSYDHIDYVVLFGDTKHTWDDCLPVEHVVDSIVTDE